MQATNAVWKWAPKEFNAHNSRQEPPLREAKRVPQKDNRRLRINSGAADVSTVVHLQAPVLTSAAPVLTSAAPVLTSAAPLLTALELTVVNIPGIGES